MTDLATLDREIVGAERALKAASEAIRVPAFGPATGLEEEMAAQRRLDALRDRRRDLLTGVAIKAPPPAPPPSLPPQPGRMTQRTASEGLKDAPELEGPEAEARNRIINEINFSAIFEDVENTIESIASAAPPRAVTLTQGHYSALVSEIAYLRGTIEFNAKMAAFRRKELEKRLGELEARPVMRYVGTYDRERRYMPGELATHRGSIWYCEKSTLSPPGDGPDWVLAVKSGRDGKDFR